MLCLDISFSLYLCCTSPWHFFFLDMFYTTILSNTFHVPETCDDILKSSCFFLSHMIYLASRSSYLYNVCQSSLLHSMMASLLWIKGCNHWKKYMKWLFLICPLLSFQVFHCLHLLICSYLLTIFCIFGPSLDNNTQLWT